MEPGDVIGDRYELRDPVGRGGMATIYQATDHRMGRIVAIKLLREVYSSDPKFVTRFQREARAASMLQHPNIVQVFDFGQSAGNYYIVMEFVEGTDLRHVIKREGPLQTERAAEIAHDVALGLGLAHRRGIVHRDVKPQNILINTEGLVKLTDFGIASVYKEADAERLTTTGMTLGTVQYYAPEQAQGEVVSPAADVYALGIVLYEMLTGRTPFDGDTPVAVAMKHIQELPEPPTHFNPRIPPTIERIIMRCLEKDPRDRYRDGDAVAYTIEQALQAPGAGSARRTASAPGGRQPYGPLSLPSTNSHGNGHGNGPQSMGTRPGAYAGPAVASGPGPRGGMREDRYGPGSGDEPTYDGPPDNVPLGPGFNDGPGARPYTRPGAPGATPPRGTPPNGYPRRPDEPQKSGRNTLLMSTVVIGVVVFLLLACSLAAVASGLPGQIGGAFAQPKPISTMVTTVPVPNFVTSTWTDAQATAQRAQLKVTKKTVTSNTAPKDQVIDQDRAAGSRVEIGTTITLTVSGGQAQVAIPQGIVSTNTTFVTYQDACGKLVNAGLTCNAQQQQYNATVPAGDVISANPTPGTQVAPGATVNLIVSEGPQPTPTKQATATATPVTPTATTCPSPTVGTATPTPIGC